MSDETLTEDERELLSDSPNPVLVGMLLGLYDELRAEVERLRAEALPEAQREAQRWHERTIAAESRLAAANALLEPARRIIATLRVISRDKAELTGATVRREVRDVLDAFALDDHLEAHLAAQPVPTAPTRTEAEQRAAALIAALPDDAELERRANLDEDALTALSEVREDALRDVILEGCWVDVARAELARRGLPP